MNSPTELETLISASINIFQQDDINSFPVLPKTPTSPAKGKRTTISLARPFHVPGTSLCQLLLWATHVLYETSGCLKAQLSSGTQTPSAGRLIRRSCNLPLQVCVCVWGRSGEGGVRESQVLASSSSLHVSLINANLPKEFHFYFPWAKSRRMAIWLFWEI